MLICNLNSVKNRSSCSQRFPLLATGPEAPILSNKSSFLPSVSSILSGKEPELIPTHLLVGVSKILGRNIPQVNLIAKWRLRNSHVQKFFKAKLSAMAGLAKVSKRLLKINFRTISRYNPAIIMITEPKSIPICEEQRRPQNKPSQQLTIIEIVVWSHKKDHSKVSIISKFRGICCLCFTFSLIF